MSALPGVLAALARDQTPLPTSWWGAFKTWLKLGGRVTRIRSAGWTDGSSTRAIGDLVQRDFLFLLAVVAAVAFAVVVNELKAGGCCGPGAGCAQAARPWNRLLPPNPPPRRKHSRSPSAGA